MRWLPPVVSASAGAATSYKVLHRLSPNASPSVVAELAAPAGDGWVSYSGASTSGTYSVVATNAAGDGPQSQQRTASVGDEGLPTDGYDIGYFNMSSRATRTDPSGAAPVAGDRAELTIPIVGHSRWSSATLMLGELAARGVGGSPVQLSWQQDAGPMLMMTSATDQCLASGVIEAFAAQWHADGRLATLYAVIDVWYCGGAKMKIVLSLRRDRSLLPALPIFEGANRNLEATYGATARSSVTVTNAGSAIQYESADIDYAFGPDNGGHTAADWSVEDDTCTGSVLEPDSTCTLDVIFHAPDDAMYAQGAEVDLRSGAADALPVRPSFTGRAVAHPDAPTVTTDFGPRWAPARPVTAFTVSDPADGPGVVTTRCRSGGGWTACTSPWTAPWPLPEGRFEVHVQPRDADGHWGDVVRAVVDVDATAPKATTSALPAATLSTSRRVTWSGTDTGGSGIAGYQLRYRAAAPGAAFGPHRYPWGWTSANGATLTLARGYQYCYSVRARDHVGNVGSWSAERCTSVALDDRSLSRATSGWTRATSARYLAGTATRTVRGGAKLSRPSVHARQLGVVVTTCSSCGPVDVYHAGRFIGRVSTRSAAPGYRVVRWLPLQAAPRAGTVVLRSVSSGRPVSVDGLLIRH